jgi:hypothetical protein
MKPEQGIPEQQQTQPDTNVTRRGFLGRLGGGTLIGIGLLGGYTNIATPIRADNETRSELEKEGITRPDKELLELSKEIRNEPPEFTVQHRKPREVWQALNTIARDDRYEREYNKRYLKKTGFFTGRLRPVTLAVNAADIAFGAYFLLRKRKVQDESTWQYEENEPIQPTIIEGNFPPGPDIDSMTPKQFDKTIAQLEKGLSISNDQENPPSIPPSKK